MRTTLLVAALVFLGAMSIHPCVSEEQTKQDEILIKRIQAGDTAAIAEAGKTGNTVFVPYLRRELKDRRFHDAERSPIGAARLALARLGERQQQQEMWCLSLSSYPEMEKFGYVGGWYSIQALQKFLNPQSLIQPYTSKHSGKEGNVNLADDVVSPPPSYIALKTLQRVVPNPPAEFDPSIAPPELDRVAKIWQDWIAAHKDDLSKLPPTGEGVDFSPNSCKNGKPKN